MSNAISGVRTGEGGVRGQPPPIDDCKINKNLSFWNDPFFLYTKIAKIAILFFCAIQFAYIILKNLDCDAITPIVKLFWCVALDVND